MNDIWQLNTTFKSAMSCIGGMDVIHYYRHPMWARMPLYVFGGRMGDCPSPAAELILEREDYDFDYFVWAGCMFVSERMRDAIALDSSVIRYFEVDDGRSAPRARAKNYQIMEPLWSDHILDKDGSVYREDSIPPAGPYGPTEIYKFALYEDAEVRKGICYDYFFSTIVLCSDEIALRVLKARCTGVEFLDPRGYRMSDVPRRRTRKGVEIFAEKCDPEAYRKLPTDKEKHAWVASRLKELANYQSKPYYD